MMGIFIQTHQLTPAYLDACAWLSRGQLKSQAIADQENLECDSCIRSFPVVLPDGVVYDNKSSITTKLTVVSR